jgi:hypothetical protein
MSAKFLVNLDLGLNQLLNAEIQQLGSDVSPAAGNKGQLYYLTTTDDVKYSTGSAVAKLTNVIESLSIGTANGLSLGSLSAKNQPISLALATSGVAGAMPGADKTKLDAATNLNTVSTIVMRDGSGNFTAGVITATTFTGALAASSLTGTLTHTFISDFDTQVRLSRLDQMAAPTAAVSMNSQRITNQADPISAQDSATKAYVDSVATGLDVKASVRFASTANVAGTYTATGGASGRGQLTAMPNAAIDGVTPAVNNRVLLKNQTTPAQNGIWVITTLGTGANGVWDRATDFDTDAEVTSGAFTFVEEGSTLAVTSWVLSTPNPITIGGASGTSLTFTQFGGGAVYTAGNGINLGGNVFSVKVDTTTTNPNSLSVSSNGVTIATTYVGQTSITTLGTITAGTWTGTAIAVLNGGTGSTTAAGARTNLGATTKFSSNLTGSSTTYTIAHGLGAAAVDSVVRVVEISTGATVYPDVTVDATNVVITFATAPSTNIYRVVVVA